MTQFDPYYKWLAIPPDEQPPNYYRLLGIRDFEDDPDVVEAAADQRIEFVQRMAKDDQGAAARKILHELSTARVCLLSENKKSVYDETLRTPASAFSNPLLDADEPIGLVEIDDEEEYSHVDSDELDEWDDTGGTYGLMQDSGAVSDSGYQPKVMYEPIDEEEDEFEAESPDGPADFEDDSDDELGADDLFSALMGESDGAKKSPKRKKKKRPGNRSRKTKGPSSTKSSKQKPVDFVFWKDQQKHARELIASRKLKEASKVLNNMASQTHPHLHRYVSWANRKLSEIKSGNISQTRTSIDLGNWVDLVYWKDQQRQVRKLLLEKEFGNAKQLLDKMAAQSHPKLSQYVGWANRKLSEIQSGDVHHSSTSIDTNSFVDMNFWKDQQRIIRVLIKTRELPEATRYLEKMAAQQSPKLDRYVDWANRKLTEIKK